MIRKIVISALLVYSCMAVLRVYSPKPLRDNFGKEGNITISYANFGHIPYGQTYVSLT